MDASPAYVCPQCKGDLQLQPQAYLCRPCDRQYPIVLDIPDFRLFPDPWISIEDDHRKGRKLYELAAICSFAELVERYWEMTPGVAPDLVREYVRAATSNHLQSANTWNTIESAAGLKSRNALLDVGCGTAGFLVATGNSFRCAVGLDIAFRWLIVARKRMQEIGLANTSLVCACAEHMPFRPGTFDLIVAEDVLDHVENQPAFARECARLLTGADGILCLSSPNRYSLGPDPHVWLWGVGFLPAWLQSRYVRWRRGIPLWPVRPVSYLQVRRLLRQCSLEPYRTLFPDYSARDKRPSLWLRFPLRCYELLRRVPLFRPLLCLVGPWFQLLCRRR